MRRRASSPTSSKARTCSTELKIRYHHDEGTAFSPDSPTAVNSRQAKKQSFLSSSLAELCCRRFLPQVYTVFTREQQPPELHLEPRARKVAELPKEWGTARPLVSPILEARTLETFSWSWIIVCALVGWALLDVIMDVSDFDLLSPILISAAVAVATAIEVQKALARRHRRFMRARTRWASDNIKLTPI
jgi:hypothetical protein